MMHDQVEAAIAAIGAEIDRRLPDAEGTSEIRKNITVLATAMTTIAARLESVERLSLVNGKSLLKAADRIDAMRNVTPLAERIAALEQRRTMSFEGSHDIGRQYRQGDCVQRACGLFVCLSSTKELPGDSAFWRRIGDSR